MVPSDTSPQTLLGRLIAEGCVPLARNPVEVLPPPKAQPVPWECVSGMLLGLAIGDALGNTSESMAPAHRFARHRRFATTCPTSSPSTAP